MRRGQPPLCFALLLGVLLACGCGPEVQTHTAHLDGAQASPPNDSPATGTVVASLYSHKRLELEGTFGNLRAPLIDGAPGAILVRDVREGAPGSIVHILEVESNDGLSGAFHGYLELNRGLLGAYLSGDWVIVIATQDFPEGEVQGTLAP